ncbi:acyl-CoA thioesterase [Glaciecola sp. 2405UD65-10]|uniref:acyl-CoA thioesterase n=1 Tax=Glaciecola sp. 2405UD65-10 TaxID=3397244 RepID=UPI003B58C7A5
MSDFQWQRPKPFIRNWQISSSNIDHYQHTNNVAYLSRLEKLAWEHSKALGLQFEDYQKADRAMVITKHELNYHLPSHLNDTLACATWITFCDKKFRLSREFQFINVASAKTCFSATTQFVCVSLQTGAPKKMPQAFYEIYAQAVHI